MKLNQNKLLESRKFLKQVSKTRTNCRNCKGKIHMAQANYCRGIIYLKF